MGHNPQSSLHRAIRYFFWSLSRCVHFIVGWGGAACRFEPTCSHYVADVFVKHGVKKGLVLSVKRLGQCHPWGNHGWDPVPEVKT